MRLKQAVSRYLRALKRPSQEQRVETWRQGPEHPLAMDGRLLSGKNVLVTGAGPNIGKGIALEMADQGANIYFTNVDSAWCKQLAEHLKSFPVQSQGFVSDISKPEAIAQLCDTLAQQQVAIDVLVHNAAVQIEAGLFEALDLHGWHQTFDTNVFGPMVLTRRVAQNMIQASIRGSIIFITSIHQWLNAGWPSYSASKAALGMIVQELAVELAPYGVRVNAIAPGWVAEDEHGTPLYSKYSLLHQVSVKPCYIGRAAVYLASDYFSSFTTGTVLKIDAGMSLYDHSVAIKRSF
jgi:NAD(P)-dependent dehydrogenase (short-subunit alcohol dehydrogenase family)